VLISNGTFKRAWNVSVTARNLNSPFWKSVSPRNTSHALTVYADFFMTQKRRHSLLNWILIHARVTRKSQVTRKFAVFWKLRSSRSVTVNAVGPSTPSLWGGCEL